MGMTGESWRLDVGTSAESRSQRLYGFSFEHAFVHVQAVEGGASVVRRQALELSHGEDRTFLADVERSDVAAAALPYPAFHAVLQARVDDAGQNSHPVENRKRVLDHDGRTDDEGD